LGRYAHVFRDADRLLEQWGFGDTRKALGSELAYGDQRSLEILLAVCQQPRVLLLDEPTADLSPLETQHVTNIIRGLPRTLSIILIEHDLDVVFDLCDSMTAAPGSGAGKRRSRAGQSGPARAGDLPHANPRCYTPR
jgi:branched-chain amino acid transport system ATP-binding protein